MISESYRFKATIGPVWSSWGWKYWSLLFGKDAIVVYPYKMREAFWLLVNYYFKNYNADPGIQVRREALEGVALESFLRERDARRLDASVIKRVEISSSYMQNRIILVEYSGKKRVYSILNRAMTDTYRQALKELYPEKYIEVDFPRTRLGKILKR
jgi:hypothetical protein